MSIQIKSAGERHAPISGPMIDAAWKNLPTQYEIDTEDWRAMEQMLRAVLEASEVRQE
jgi:hypothetical protein